MERGLHNARCAPSVDVSFRLRQASFCFAKTTARLPNPTDPGIGVDRLVKSQRKTGPLCSSHLHKGPA